MIPVRVLFILASVAALSIAAPALPLDDEQALLESLSAEFSAPKSLQDSNVDTAVDVQTSVSDGPASMTFKGYYYQVVKFNGLCGSRNIMDACKAAGLDALCDHPSYVNHGYQCINVPGMNGHWSYEPHVQSIMGNSQLTAMMRYKYFYVGINSHSGYSHYNTAGSHRGAGQGHGSDQNGGSTVCARKLVNHDEHVLPILELLENLRQKLLATVKSTNDDIAAKDAKMKKTRRESDETIRLAEEAAAKDAGIFKDATSLGNDAKAKANKELEMLAQIVKAVDALNGKK